MSCRTEVVDLLRRAGQRVTLQRVTILESLRHSSESLTAQSLFDVLKREHPIIDLSTVYRTLSWAQQIGVISHINRPGRDTEFEWRGDNHHHLICRTCGWEAELDATYLERLERDVSAAHGFQPDLDHLALYGLCEVCKKGETRA
jgi:Fur family ferric uptake transcriptional regulator